MTACNLAQPLDDEPNNSQTPVTTSIHLSTLSSSLAPTTPAPDLPPVGALAISVRVWCELPILPHACCAANSKSAVDTSLLLHSSVSSPLADLVLVEEINILLHVGAIVDCEGHILADDGYA